MNSTTIDRAVRRLEESFEYPGRVEVLLVGGAAGIVTGLLPVSRTTIDCDVMVYSPESARQSVESAAETVAGELGLARNWFNSDVQIRIDTLPDGWLDRRVFVGEGKCLRVFAASRVDLIAMKFLAGRPQDLEDLHALRVREDDAAFVRTYLSLLGAKGTRQSQIEDARELLDSWPVAAHE